MYLHRANTAVPLTAHHHGSVPLTRAVSPRQPVKPDFREGTTVEERDKTGRVVTRFRVGRLLGRGGFASCYEFTEDVAGAPILACKVIDRASLQKSKTQQKLQSEIAIHKRMKHKNIVNFLRTFQDEWFVYILLERCTNQTLMEIAKRRARFSLPETQYLMLQTIAAIQYMHEQNVIHRDLKLGNIMMDQDMNVKVGDFGLAAELAYDGERKRTICGTPNYIAPEILANANNGHSFEVDVWSLGVILYTLLVGEPPFQTSDVKTTYNRIKQCRYEFPATVPVPQSGKDLVHRILQSRPDHRPTLLDIRKDPFFYVPAPPTTAPLTLFPEHVRRRMERDGAGSRDPTPTGGASAREAMRPLWTANAQPAPAAAQARASPRDAPAVLATVAAPVRGVTPTTSAVPLSERGRTSSVPALKRSDPAPTIGGWCVPPAQEAARRSSAVAPAPAPEAAPLPAAPRRLVEDEEDRHHLTQIHDRLHQSMLGGAAAAEEPQSMLTPPSVWVTDYADFSSKYGLAYRLSTGHTGVHYNDSTKMVWEPITGRTEYYARVRETVNGVVQAQDRRESFVMDAFPEPLTKKVTLIKYFKNYLSRSKGRREGVEVVGCSPFVSTAPVLLSEPNMVSDMPYVKRWLLTNEAMIFRLSNKMIQVAFRDRAEVLLSSESRVVTYTDPAGNRRTLLLSQASQQSDEIASRLSYTKDILSRLINNREL